MIRARRLSKNPMGYRRDAIPNPATGTVGSEASRGEISFHVALKPFRPYGRLAVFKTFLARPIGHTVGFEKAELQQKHVFHHA